MEIQDNNIRTKKFLWQYDFLNSNPIFQNISNTKTSILNRYAQQVAPALVNARKLASTGGAKTIDEIDEFYLGNSDGNGFIAKLQSEYDKIYSQSIRSAHSLFTSGNFNRNLQNWINTKHKLGEVPTVADLKGTQYWDTFSQMLQTQEDIVNNMMRLLEIAEPYALAMAAQNRTNKKRRLTSKKLQNGLYDLNDFNADGQSAIKLYEDIKRMQQQMQSALAVNQDGIVQANFIQFRNLVEQYHKDYGEHVGTLALYKYAEAEGKVGKGIKKAHAMMMRTGSRQASIGNGGISITQYLTEDPDLRDSIESFKGGNMRMTVKNDNFMLLDTSDGSVSEIGLNIKDYSPESVKRFGGKFIIDSYSSVLNAARLATQYGLPAALANEDKLTYFTGSLYGAYGKNGIQIQLWKDYLEMIAKLLTVDAIMGRMGNGIVSKQSNSLVLVTNGKVEYVPEVLKQITLDNIGYTNRGIWSLETGKESLRTNIAAIQQAEEEHWTNLISGGSGSTAYSNSNARLKSLGIKIYIDLNSVLTNAKYR